MRAHGVVAQPERAGEIDDADAGVDERRARARRPPRRAARGTRRRPRARASRARAARWRRPRGARAPAAAAPRRPSAPDDIAAVSATAGWRDEQAQQLLAGVAGGAGDRDARARRGARPPSPRRLHRAAQLYASERIVIHMRYVWINKNRCILMLRSAMKTRRQAVILELIDREGAPQPGAAAPPAAPARLRRHAGDDLARHHGARPREARRRRRLPARRAPTRPTRRRRCTALERAAAEFLRRIERVQQLVVIRTGARPGAGARRGARPRAAARSGRHDRRRRHDSRDRARRARAPPRSSSGSRSTRRNAQPSAGWTRIVLAYSGGLETSVAIPWLAERHARRDHRRHARPRAGQGRLEEIRDRALATGALRAHVLDVRDEFARDYIVRALKAGAILRRRCRRWRPRSARPLIAQKLVEIADIEQATTVAHGDPAGRARRRSTARSARSTRR